MNNTRRYSPQILITLAVVVTIARGFSEGLYAYGISNQTSQLPLIKHAIDPTYLSTDWNVMVRTGLGSPRFIYTQFVATISHVFGIPVTVFGIYILSTAIGVGALYLLLNEVFEDRFVSILTIGTVLSPLTRYINLGGNALFQQYLIPSHLANALILLGLAIVVRKRYRLGFTVLGIATLFHVVNGFWMSLVAGVCVVAMECSQSLRSGNMREAVKRVPWTAAGIYGTIALIGVVPLLLENLSNSTSFHSIYLMAWVRHPHHYIPSTWPRIPLIVTMIFTVGTTSLLWYFRGVVFATKRSSRFVFTWIGTLSIIFIGGGVFTELYPVSTIIKLQTFHVDDFLFILLYGGVWKLGVDLFYTFSNEIIANDIITSPHFLSQAAVVCLTVTLLLAVAVSGVNFTAYEEPQYSSSLSESYDWISTETPEDATFIASPALQGFRLETSRAMVVNTKSFPFRPTAMEEWGERIKTVCNISGQLTNSKLSSCETTYEHLEEDTLRQTAARYDVCWVLSRNQTYSFDQEFSNNKYTVYHLQNSTHC